MFTHLEEPVGSYDEDWRGTAGSVEFRYPDEDVKLSLSSCVEMRSSRCRTGTVLSCCSRRKDTPTRVVTTAENKPAYIVEFCRQSTMNEVSLNVLTNTSMVSISSERSFTRVKSRIVLHGIVLHESPATSLSDRDLTTSLTDLSVPHKNADSPAPWPHHYHLLWNSVSCYIVVLKSLEDYGVLVVDKTDS